MSNNKVYDFSDLDRYLRQDGGDSRERAANWQTAIGLQAVDGLHPSAYLLETAKKHIEGEIDIDEAGVRLRGYYESKTQRTPDDEATEEADLVAHNIAKILSSRTLDFSTEGYIAVHRKVFDGVFPFAGKLRDYNISKQEWVLNGDGVCYLNHEDLYRAITHDLEQERQFSYKGLSIDQSISHLCSFVSGLWQIHPFGEGNTRTTAVFCIQYLRSIGFEIGNDMFAHHSWYFRNALVRANYKNVQRGIDYDYTFLERFFRNLLLGEQYELKNRYLHLDYKEHEQVANKWRTSSEQVDEVDANVVALVEVIGVETLSVKQIMEAMGVKHRPSLLYHYLQPSIEQGFVGRLYPNNPKHPRQKYRLTVKGLALHHARTAR